MRKIVSLLGEMIPASTQTMAKTGTKVERFASRFGVAFPLSTEYGMPVIHAKNAKLISLGPKNTAKLPNNMFYTKPDQFLSVTGINGEKAIFCFKDGQLITHNRFKNGHTDVAAAYKTLDSAGNKTDDFELLKQYMKDAQMSDEQLWR